MIYIKITHPPNQLVSISSIWRIYFDDEKKNHIHIKNEIVLKPVEWGWTIVIYDIYKHIYTVAGHG